MSDVLSQRHRTGWDIALGALMCVLGLLILGHAVIATAVSVVFVGWVLVIGGLVGLVASFFRIGKGGFWSAALGGVLLTILGIVILRHTTAAVVTLTLVAGTLFLVSGAMRWAEAAQEREHRAILIASGAVSVVLGLLVVFNLLEASFVLLGVLLGIQAVVDGVTLMMLGRPHTSVAGTRVAMT